MIIVATGVCENLYSVRYTGFFTFGKPYWWCGGVCFRNIGMDVVLFSVAADETAAQLIHRGAQDPEPLVALGEYLLQRFDFQFQGV